MEQEVAYDLYICIHRCDNHNSCQYNLCYSSGLLITFLTIGKTYVPHFRICILLMVELLMAACFLEVVTLIMTISWVPLNKCACVYHFKTEDNSSRKTTLIITLLTQYSNLARVCWGLLKISTENMIFRWAAVLFVCFVCIRTGEKLYCHRKSSCTQSILKVLVEHWASEDCTARRCK